jgi:hypothetical protein
MTRRIKGIFAAAVLCGVCLAQETTQAPPSAGAPPAQTVPAQSSPPQQAASSQTQTSASQWIAPGSVVPVQLTRSIDAKKIKPGDPVEAKVTQDLKTGDGQVIVPKDTKIVGRITEAQARSKEQKESQVGIAFDHAVMKTGGDVQLPMSTQAIIAPAGLNSNNNGGNSESVNQASSQSSSQSSSAPNGGMSGNTNGRSGGMGAGAPLQFLIQRAVICRTKLKGAAMRSHKSRETRRES